MRSRKKPGSRSFAGTGERPISLKGEAKLDKAIADATEEKKQRIKILEEENARLQVRLEQKQEEIEGLLDEDAIGE